MWIWGENRYRQLEYFVLCGHVVAWSIFPPAECQFHSEGQYHARFKLEYLPIEVRPCFNRLRSLQKYLLLFFFVIVSILADCAPAVYSTRLELFVYSRLLLFPLWLHILLSQSSDVVLSLRISDFLMTMVRHEELLDISYLQFCLTNLT